MYGFAPYSTLPYSDITLGANSTYVEIVGTPLNVALGTLRAGLGARVPVSGFNVGMSALVGTPAVKAKANAFAGGIQLDLRLGTVIPASSNRIRVSGFPLVVDVGEVIARGLANVAIAGVELRVLLSSALVWSPIVNVPICEAWAPIENPPDCDAWAVTASVPDGKTWAPIVNTPDCEAWKPIENEPDCDDWSEVLT